MQERPQTPELLKQQLGQIVSRLERDANDRVAQRSPTDTRMLEDTGQYHGQYTKTQIADFTKRKQSQTNINLTASKTDAMSARLQDLLFPTDDRNWGIGPTPVPEMAEQAKVAKSKIDEVQPKLEELKALAQSGDPQANAAVPELEAQIESLKSVDNEMRRTVEEAKTRSERMATLIDDQLKECQYHAVMRDVIEDACKLGIGIVKGPVRTGKARRRWVLTEGQFQLGKESEDSVGFQRVNPWGFYPAMDVTDIADGEGIYERHLMTPQRLRKLQHMPGFDKEALRTLLKSEPRNAAPQFLSDLKSITGEGSTEGKFYQVWEYSGPLSAEEMRDLAVANELEDIADEMEGEIDPLQEVQARVWFCQGEILKFAIYPYDSGEPMYSVFNLKKDESSVFGFGIPYIMRHAQDMLNAAARQMMNNAGVASGPQIVIDTEQLMPADPGAGWDIEPFKVWLAKSGIPKDEDYFRIYHIDSHQAELAAIMAIAQKHIDDETGLTALAQGDQGSGVTKTAQGMAILINATNIVFRRIVKNFDDDVTVPNIRRLYDWNMQFSEREDIKGDFEVDARGSSVLLAREMQAQNLRLFALEFGSHPIYGPMMKHLDLLKKSCQTLMIPVDEVVKDEDTIKTEQDEREKKAAEMAKAEAATGGMSPEEMQFKQAELGIKSQAMQLDAARANMEADVRLKVAMASRETAMMELAANGNIKMEEIAAKLQDSREKRDLEMTKINIEQIMTLATGQTAGGLV